MPGKGVSNVEKHPDYYFSDGDVTFIVGDKVFRVHSYFFRRESVYFRAQFFTNYIPETSTSSTLDKNPFRLEEIDSADFAQLLWVFYNPTYQWDASEVVWLTILQLAQKWEFSNVKAFAVRELEKKNMDPVHKIVTYTKHNVDVKLLIPAYAALTAREETISLEEGKQLELETTLKIMRAREYARGKPASGGLLSPIPSDLDEQGLNAIVSQVFNVSLDAPTSKKSQGSGSNSNPKKDKKA